MNEEKQIPRTWENLPSMVMTSVPKVFSYFHLVKSIIDQAPDKQLVCLIQLGRSSKPDNTAHLISLLYKSTEDPQLVLMRFLAPVPSQEQIIIRASFMRETVLQVTESNLYDLTERLSKVAIEKGFNATTTE